MLCLFQVNVTYLPNFGTLIAPWQVAVSFADAADKPTLFVLNARRQMRADSKADPSGGVYAAFVDAEISYPCPAPFCPASGDNAGIARNATATIKLPPHIALAKGQAATVSLGATFEPASTRRGSRLFCASHLTLAYDVLDHSALGSRSHGLSEQEWFERGDCGGRAGLDLGQSPLHVLSQRANSAGLQVRFGSCCIHAEHAESESSPCAALLMKSVAREQCMRDRRS